MKMSFPGSSAFPQRLRDARFIRPQNLTGWRITVAALALVILLAVVLVLAWGDTRPFPKVLDKEIPTRLVSVSAELQEDLESGAISGDLRRTFSDKGAGLSDRAEASTVKQGSEWLITDAGRKFEVVKEGSNLNIGGGLLTVGSAEYQGDFERGIISKTLREGLRFNDIGISDNAKISTQEEGRSWLITDPTKKYAVTKQNYLIVGDEVLVLSPHIFD